MYVDDPELDEFIEHYIEAALFESTDDDGDQLRKNYDCDDIAREAIAKIVDDCTQFFTANRDVWAGQSLRSSRSWSETAQAAHDFWFTRVGAGVGFWETSDWEEEAGKVLTAAAKRFGACDVYVGDDEKLYVSPA